MQGFLHAEQSSALYECVDIKERFTTTEQDEVSVGQIYTKYRLKYAPPCGLEYRKSCANLADMLIFVRF